MNQLNKTEAAGFTIIELIVVVVLLGILSVGVSTFLKFGIQIYSEASAREQLVSSARFVIERLNRELRNALPNSIRLTNAKQCIQFMPIVESTIYTDIPVAPKVPRDNISVIRFDAAFSSSWNVVVYPLTPEDVYGNNNKVFGVDNITTTGNEWLITLDDSDVVFAEDSPTQRLYFIDSSVSYCLQNNALYRNGILMAQNIYNIDPFDIEQATLQRNAMVQVHLRFEKNVEKVVFNNEVQVLNVP